jgi:peptidoglycan hydrolase CwlO-like protein
LGYHGLNRGIQTMKKIILTTAIVFIMASVGSMTLVQTSWANDNPQQQEQSSKDSHPVRKTVKKVVKKTKRVSHKVINKTKKFVDSL